MKFFLLGLMAFSSVAAASDSAPMALEWDGMKGTFEFEDPFTKLTQEQIYHLALVARVRSFDEKKRKVSEPMRKEAEEAATKLVEEKIDIDGLLEKRKEVAKQRKERAGAPVEELNGKLVKLSGFVLPLEYDDQKKVTEFLLVPWVGACIHTPPPPPNQIAHVIPGVPFLTKGTFEAVTVTGTLSIEKREEELFLVDGKAMVPTSYSFSGAKVEKYQQEK